MSRVNSHCQETCSIVYQEVSREVKVKRRSGKGPQVCQMKPTEGICEDRCCLARCSNESYELRADGNGPWHFQDCQLDKSLFLLGEGYKCQERCTVLHSQEPAEVEVLRKPGADVQPECQLKQVRLQDAAMDFVDQLENKALTLQTNRYGDLPLMNKRTVISFLQQVKAEVIHPEFENSPGHGYSRQILSQTNQTIAIIGDLHGQLFNLIAYLVTIKEKYEGEDLSILDGSSLLYCDPRMHYLFMGDYVDRGERGVELLLLLLAYKASVAQQLTQSSCSIGRAHAERRTCQRTFQQNYRSLTPKFNNKATATDPIKASSIWAFKMQISRALYSKIQTHLQSGRSRLHIVLTSS